MEEKIYRVGLKEAGECYDVYINGKYVDTFYGLESYQSEDSVKWTFEKFGKFNRLDSLDKDFDVEYEFITDYNFCFLDDDEERRRIKKAWDMCLTYMDCDKMECGYFNESVSYLHDIINMITYYYPIVKFMIEDKGNRGRKQQ